MARRVVSTQVFRKRSIEITALHFDSTAIADYGVDQIAEWCGGKPLLRNGHLCIEIPTRDGDMRAQLDDWIIQEPFPGSSRKFYPCKPEIFDATYEAA